MKHIALAALLALPTFGAGAESIFRCGNSYQQTPCSGATIVDAGDARTKAQWVEAKAVAAEERRLGQAMERERLVSEARAPAAPSALTAPTAIKAHVGTKAKRPAKVKQRRGVELASASRNDFIAVAPRGKPR